MKEAIERLVNRFREDVAADNSIDGADAVDAVAEFVRAYEAHQKPDQLTPDAQALVNACEALVTAASLYRLNYGKLHDMLSDAIEGGRLKEVDIPNDYAAFVTTLTNGDKADRALVEALIPFHKSRPNA